MGIYSIPFLLLAPSGAVTRLDSARVSLYDSQELARGGHWQVHV